VKANILTIFPHKNKVLNYLLFVLYLVVLSWAILRVPFLKNAGISSGLLLSLFLIKIIAGIAIGWVSIHVYGPGNDYWDTNDYAREEYQLLLANPWKYFINIFTSDYESGYSGIFSNGYSYWNDLKGDIVIKLVSVFNIFSRGDYYINSLFFNFLVFFGHVILFRLFIKIFPGRQIWVIIGCFLLPSTLYFASGIHKDGLVFLMLAVLTFSVFQSCIKNSFSAKRVGLICTSLLFLFLLRNFVFLALIPALLAWILSAKAKWRTGLTFVTVYLLCCLLAFNIDSVFSKIKPLEIITNRQTEYFKLGRAASQIELDTLRPTFISFVNNTPQALNHALLRPYLWEIPVKSVFPLSIELFLYQVLLLILIFFRKDDAKMPNKPVLYFIGFFALSVLLFVGYVVPNLGSLVRYRSLYLHFIITPILCYVDWEKILKKIQIIFFKI
jgi:hypothetical protein